MPIKLSLPDVQLSADPGVETRAVYVEEWVESLAYANPPALLEQTLEAIERLNRQPLRSSLRMELLDLLVHPYAFALAFRRTQEPAVGAASLNRQRLVSRRLRLCALALALGYKQALVDQPARRSRFGGTRELRLSLQRSTLFSSLGLLHCYDEYRPTQPGLWLETMALYERAAREGVDGDRVTARVDDETFCASVADCFRRLCLTSLVDPYHLAYGELWTVYEAFGQYAGLARLTGVQETRRPAGRFIVDPTVDARPAPLAQARETPDPRCRLLDANPVLDAVRARLANAGNRRDPLAAHVLAAMVRALGLPPRRHSPREGTDGRVRLAAGLSTVHHFMGGGSTDARTARGGGEIVASTPDGVAGGLASSYRYESWDLVDEGPGGVGLLRREPPEIALGVGDLVGLQFPMRGDADDEWSLGVVRWLNVDDACHAGVQSLGASAMPVMAHSETVTDTITRIPRPALALPAVNADPASSLLAPRGLFSRGDSLRLSAGGSTWMVRTVAVSESTAAFDRFTFRILEGG